MTDSSSVTVSLPESLSSLLREVLERRAPELLTAIQGRSQVVINEHQKGVLQELLGDEFCETGLRGDDEPNQRGLDLEKLIDAFSPYK